MNIQDFFYKLQLNIDNVYRYLAELDEQDKQAKKRQRLDYNPDESEYLAIFSAHARVRAIEFGALLFKNETAKLCDIAKDRDLKIFYDAYRTALGYMTVVDTKNFVEWTTDYIMENPFDLCRLLDPNTGQPLGQLDYTLVTKKAEIDVIRTRIQEIVTRVPQIRFLVAISTIVPACPLPRDPKTKGVNNGE